MKRCIEIRKLSDDHHKGLVLARHALMTTDSGSVEKLWSEIEIIFRDELNPHFLIEERYLAPPMKKLGEFELLYKFHDDHLKLRDLVNNQSAHTLQTLHEFGRLLRAHIHFEERELFEVAQQRLTRADLLVIQKVCERGESTQL